MAKRATRKWAHEDHVIAESLECLIPDKSFYKKTLLSPAQVDKILGKKKSDIEDLWIKESSGNTLVEESDKRPAVSAGPAVEFKPLPKGG